MTHRRAFWLALSSVHDNTECRHWLRKSPEFLENLQFLRFLKSIKSVNCVRLFNSIYFVNHVRLVIFINSVNCVKFISSEEHFLTCQVEGQAALTGVKY